MNATREDERERWTEGRRRRAVFQARMESSLNLLPPVNKYESLTLPLASRNALLTFAPCHFDEDWPHFLPSPILCLSVRTTAREGPRMKGPIFQFLEKSDARGVLDEVWNGNLH